MTPGGRDRQWIVRDDEGRRAAHAARVLEMELLRQGRYPSVPDDMCGALWEVALPPVAASHIATSQFVYRDPGGELRSPIVERVAREWAGLRRGGAPLRRWEVTRLLDVLTYLFPGPTPNGMTQERLDELVSEGSIDQDGFFRVDPIETERARTAAAYTLAVVLGRRWKVRQDEREPLHLVAQDRGLSLPDAKVTLCAEGLVLASARESDPLGSHPGRQWGSNKDRPAHEVDVQTFLLWLAAAAIGEAKAILSGEKKKDPSEELAERPHPLDALIATSELQAIKDVASLRQREILDAWLAAYAGGAADAEARREAAADVGIEVATLDVHLHRLRKKLGGM